MKCLYELVQDAKNSTIALENIIQMFELKIKKLIYMTNINNRDDLTQELRMKMIKYITEYDLDSVPGFWELKEKVSNEKS